MIAIEGTYYNGNIELSEIIDTIEPVKVIITFIDEKICLPAKSLKREKFHFDKAREISKVLNSSLSNELIEERKKEV